MDNGPSGRYILELKRWSWDSWINHGWYETEQEAYDRIKEMRKEPHGPYEKSKRLPKEAKFRIKESQHTWKVIWEELDE